ncbi:MAG: hypothetical protein E7335_02435 [Clostridiales bacterium]|nr:hypothetical protein [Clostridiales bacterium]
MNRTKRYLHNSAAALAAELITMIVGFITPRVILTTYGSEINGLTSSILQFMSYFNLVEAGLSNATVYALYKPFAQKDHAAVSSVMAAARRLYLRSGLIFIALALILSLIYPFYIQVEGLSPLDVGLLVLILGVSNALNFFTLSKHRALVNADQRMYVISISSIVHALVNTLIIIVLANSGVNVVMLRFWALAAVFLRALILALYCRKNYAYIDPKAEPNYPALSKSKDALFHEILFAIHKGAPIALITVLLRDMATVSVYNVYSMIITGVAGVLSVFSSGLAPSFGNVITLGEKDTLKRAYGEFEFSYYTLLTAVYAVTIIMIMPFIRIYTSGVTDAVYDLPLVGLLFSVNSLMHNVRMPQSMLIVAGGHYKETRIHSLGQTIISVTLSAALIYPFGIVGLLIALICANAYRAIMSMVFVPCQYRNLSMKLSFIRALRMVATIAITVLPFFFIQLVPAGYVQWALYAVGVGVYACIVAIVSGAVFELRELKAVFVRIRRMFSSGKR